MKFSIPSVTVKQRVHCYDRLIHNIFSNSIRFFVRAIFLTAATDWPTYRHKMALGRQYVFCFYFPTNNRLLPKIH